MLGAPHSEQEFTKRMRDIVEANFHNEQFGVIELATKMGKSRSYLHRHLKKITNQSVSQFIRTIRLEKAMELLLQNDDPASEVAYKVGFGSPAYFNHCFHEHYGYPPGEVRKKIFREEVIIDDKLHNLPQKSRIKWLHHILQKQQSFLWQLY